MLTHLNGTQPLLMLLVTPDWSELEKGLQPLYVNLCFPLLGSQVMMHSLCQFCHNFICERL